MQSRKEQWRRVSALAGVDENGGILPPSADGAIERAPNPYWRPAKAVPVAKEDEPLNIVSQNGRRI